MMNFFSVALLLTIGCLSSSSQVTLKIVVKDLDSNDGAVILDLRDDKDQHLEGFSGEISNNECTIVVDSLKTGEYSFRYFHDKNNNEKLDTYWIGIPKEGYGFSNNAKGKYGPPNFEKTVFEVVNDTTMFCTPYYFKL